MPPATKPAQKTERLNELAFSFKNAGTLIGAIELGLFTAISEGSDDAEKLAVALSLPFETIDRLIIACKSLDLIVHSGGLFKNADDVERYLVRTKRTYLGDFLAYEFHRRYSEWEGVSQRLRGSGKPKQESYYIELLQNPEEARKFTVAGYESAIGLAHVLPKRFDFSTHRRWLDFAGGSGVYSIVACERYPELTALVLDQEHVIPVTREFIAKHGLEDRVKAQTGDFRNRDEYPPGFDLISFITPLQGYMPDEVRRFFTYAFEALEPGGEILVVDYMLEDDKAGPLDPALVNLSQVVDGHCTGRVNSGAEFYDFLRAAGFDGVEVQWLLSHQLGLVTARKPPEIAD